SIVLVFVMLIVLCLIITLEGKAFDRANRKPTDPAAPPAPPKAVRKAPPKPAAKPAPAPAAPAPAAPAPGGIPGEVIAAISAAVATVLGEDAVVHSVRRVQAPGRASRRGAWGDAAVREQTTPFV
ncbi:MAG TPA: OadG family protein, partial [Candidatus Gemmiger excrementipullorum]|nr:OadG family protein [Candidatus Gemmiger excrementipullorum]